MTSSHTVDEARLSIMLNDLQLPTIKILWPQFAEQADREGWPAARFLGAFARGLRREQAAVAAALRDPWSNRQINRLMTLKRQMYERANIDLHKAQLVQATGARTDAQPEH